MLLNLFIYLRIEGGLFSKLGNTPATSPPETLLNFSLVKLEIKNKQQICMLLRYRISNDLIYLIKCMKSKQKPVIWLFIWYQLFFFPFFLVWNVCKQGQDYRLFHPTHHSLQKKWDCTFIWGSTKKTNSPQFITCCLLLV